MRPVVYRFFRADGSLLYIGSTGDWLQRMGQHESGRPWWGEVDRITLEHHGTIRDARRAEGEAIIRERPEHNAPVGVARRETWRTRTADAAERHATGRVCASSAICVTCRLARARARYAEHVGSDLDADVIVLRGEGKGRERVAQIIRRRLGGAATQDMTVRVFTTAMVEHIEYAAAERAS